MSICIINKFGEPMVLK